MVRTLAQRPSAATPPKDRPSPKTPISHMR
jgi:hypothetical protein